MKFINITPLNETAVTSVFIPSAAIDASDLYKLSAQIVAGAGDATGSTIQMQVSNDPVANGYLSIPTPSNWVNLGTPITIVASDSALMPAIDMCYRSMRFVYASDGTASLASVVVNVFAIAV